MPEGTTSPRSYWLLRRLQREWRAWKRVGRQVLWPAGLLLVTLLSHLYLANRAVVLWADIQSLRAQNWEVWWDIQSLTSLRAEQERRALETYLKSTTWIWPSPDDVVHVPSSASLSDTWDVTGWGLPPLAPSGEVFALPEIYTQSLWDLFQRWWQRRAFALQEARP